MGTMSQETLQISDRKLIQRAKQGDGRRKRERAPCQGDNKTGIAMYLPLKVLYYIVCTTYIVVCKDLKSDFPPTRLPGPPTKGPLMIAWLQQEPRTMICTKSSF